MQIDCPHCKQSIDVVESEQDSVTRCPRCGSSVAIVAETKTYQRLPAPALDNYDLVEVIGQGQSGKVWKAFDRTLERWVAVKVPRSSLDEETRQRFKHEAKAASQLTHSNIVRIYGVPESDSQLYIVSELIEGVSLSDLMQERRFTPRDAAALCATVADALQHAHDAGVIHRDLKPANILMDRERQPHVTDFGIAKRNGAEITMTLDGQILGTPAYMSPEQAAGKAHSVDGRSDVYSLGVVLYELLCGSRPFQGSSKHMLVFEILECVPDPPRKINKHVPVDLQTICLCALEKQPVKRYASAAGMAADLRRFLAGEPIHKRPVSRIARGYRWCKRKPAMAALIAVSALLAIVAAGYFWPQPPPTGSKRVLVTTTPKNADVTWYRIQDNDPSSLSAEPAAEGHDVYVFPGIYWVVAIGEAGAYQMALRTVPEEGEDASAATFEAPIAYPHKDFQIGEDGTITVPPVTIVPQALHSAMMTVGANARFSSKDHQLWFVAEYSVDTSEVTRGDFRAVFPDHPAVTKGVRPDNFPMTDVSWDDAVAYAEATGKTLAPAVLYEYTPVALGPRQLVDQGVTADAWDLGPTLQPAASPMQVIQLDSNALEWTATRARGADIPDDAVQPEPGLALPDAVRKLVLEMFLVCGGPQAALSGRNDTRAAHRFAQFKTFDDSRIGFRCIRWSKPPVGESRLRVITP